MTDAAAGARGWTAIRWPTAELRWFGPGEVPDGLRAWLRGRGLSLIPQAPRTDHYLSLPQIPGVGVKLREGRLEIKQAVGVGREVGLGPLSAGVCQRWLKWSFPLLLGHQAQVALRPPEWIPVRKERDLVYLELVPVGQVQPVLEGAIPARDCTLELAALEVQGARWWSLGFEAYGDEATVDGIVVAVARQLLEGDPGPGLPVETSWSYPEWLVHVCRPEDG